MKHLSFFQTLLPVLILLSACSSQKTEQAPSDAIDTVSREVRGVVMDQSKQILTALAERNMKDFSSFAHPTKGIRFSPYGYVDIENNIVMTQLEIMKYSVSDEKIAWGHYDGSGEPIQLSLLDFVDEFLMEHDYRTAKKIGYNEILGHGNSLNNIKEVYPDGVFIEYYIPSIDPQYEGMDWGSIRLVFEQNGEFINLVGVISDQWTI